MDVNDLRLLMDTNNDGSFADETPIGGAIDLGNGLISFPSITALDNNARFTLASTQPMFLPVELTHFNAEIQARQAFLDWSTASEKNSAYFEVQRSSDAQTWTTIDQIASAGTTTQTTDYQMIDPAPLTGWSYYRLRQVDFDGTTTYSEIRAEAGQGDINQNTQYIDVSVYPNPVHDVLNVRFNKLPKKVNAATVNILSIDGQVVHSFQAGVQSYQVLDIEYVQQLTPAVYLLSIELSNSQKIIQKFIKQ